MPEASGDDMAQRLRQTWRQVQAVEQTSADIADRARARRATRNPPRQTFSRTGSGEVAQPHDADARPATAAVLARDDDPVTTLAELGVRLPPLSPRLRTTLGTSVWTGSLEPGVSGPELWTAIRGRFPQTGWWPLLLDPAVWTRTESAAPLPDTELDGATWFATQRNSRTADHTPSDGEPALGITTSSPDPFDPHHDRWHERWTATTGRPYRELAVIAAPHPWLIPALLGWSGAINYQIGAREHTAVLRHWFTRWSAEPVGFGADRLHLRVAHPPRTLHEASTVAFHAWLYCPDTFDGAQYGEIPIARSMTSSLWSFWWD
ncbi:DUF4253 domain-containing protein [Nocardia sp. NPDC004582]